MTELTARVCQLHDTEANWIKNANDKVLNAGEIVVYDPDAQHTYQRIKIGDGKTPLKDLKFVIEENLTTDKLQQGDEELILFCGGAPVNE